MADLEVVASRLVDLAGRVDGKVDKDGGSVSGNFSVGGNLTAGGQPYARLAGVKTANLPRATSPVTRSADPDLLVVLPANATFEIRCMLHYFCVTGGTGLAFGFFVPTGANGRWGIARDAITAGDVTAQGYQWGDTTLLATPANLNVAALILGTVWTGASSGNFGISWANGTAGVSVNLNLGSYLVADRII